MIDNITEEIRAIRHTLAEQCDNDIDRIFERLQKTASSSGRNYVSLPMRPVSEKTIAKPEGPADHSTPR